MIQLRKEQGMTQQGFADMAGIHINQVRRYESGSTQPTLEGLVKVAKALHVSLDDLVFGEDERGPSQKGLKLLVEAIEELEERDQEIICEVLEGLVFKYQAKRWL